MKLFSHVSLIHRSQLCLLTSHSEKMIISSEIFTSDGLNVSDYSFYNATVLETGFKLTPVLYIILILLVFPINSYVIWLIVTGTGNGLATEIFNLNLAVCEIFIWLESVLSQLTCEVELLYIVLHFLDGLAITARPLFLCLICFERYLAVVHPLTFLKYKPLRYRVICSVIAWVANLVSGGIISIPSTSSSVYFGVLFVQFFLFLCIQLFCLVTVLRALKQSVPGERGKGRNGKNNMKRKAFQIILITTVTMLMMYAPYTVVVALCTSSTLPDLLSSISFVCFTSAGLVQPIFFFTGLGSCPSSNVTNSTLIIIKSYFIPFTYKYEVVGQNNVNTHYYRGWYHFYIQ